MKMVLSSQNLEVYHITMTAYPETIGGIQSFIKTLDKALLEENIASSVTSLGVMSKRNRTPEAFRIPVFGTYPYLLIVSFLSALVFTIRHKKKPRLRACVIHAHDMLFGGLTGALIKVLLKSPLVITDHGLQSVIESYTYDQKHGNRVLSRLFKMLLLSVERFVASHADRIMCVGKYSYEYFLNQGVDPVRVKIVRSGVDTDRFRPRRSPFSGSDIMMLYAGRMSVEKGIVDLINVFGLLEKECPELKLLIVGEGAEKETIEQMLEKKPEGKVRLLPMVERTSIENLYNNSDIVVVPSVAETGTPMSLLEAMACGRAVIVNPSGSLSEIVGNAGLTAPFGNPSEAFVLIKDLVNDRRKAIELAASARKRAVKAFNWSNCFHEIVNTYIDAFNELKC